jgi:GNAT superfamily N-acetyltransferase
MNINQLFPSYTCYLDHFLISTDAAMLDIDMIHDYLANHSYWARGRSKALVSRFVRFSTCFGVYDLSDNHTKQVGFARTVTDFSTFAYLADVFILPDYQRRGLGKWLVASIMAHPELQNLRKWTLQTRDAHTLYTRFGFAPHPVPENYLEFRPNQKPSGEETAVSPAIP